MNRKRVYFTIDSLSIEIESSTPYVLEFFKKQYGLTPTVKKSFNYQLIFNVKPQSIFKLHILRKTGEVVFPKYEDFSHFSFFFNFIVQLFVLRHNIVLIHASSIEKWKKGYVFSGPSGIGKTTILKNIKPSYIYSNDVAVLKKIAGDFMLLCSPFDRFFVPSKQRVRLEKIFFLQQAKNTTSKNLSNSKSYELLLKNSIFYYFLDTIMITSKNMYSKNHMMDIKIPNYYRLVQKNLLQILAHRPLLLLNKKKDDPIYLLIENL